MTAIRSLLFLCALASATRVTAQTTATPPALPAWPDESPSVYTAARTVAPPVSTAPEPTTAPQPHVVQPAAFTAPTESAPVAAAEPSTSDSRRLGPRRNRLTRPHEQTKTDAAELPSFGVPLDSMYTTAAALAVVVGLFLLCAGLVRRGAKKSNSRLPEEVVSVLGRVPLAARQYAELVRVGNKLVLVSITPTGAEPLTEITDPAEIDRLLGLCKQGTKGSSTAEFDQVFRQLAEETAPPGFLGREVPHHDARLDTRLAAATDVFAAYRGGAKVG
jgi:flagellar biogenesis protein FliO